MALTVYTVYICDSLSSVSLQGKVFSREEAERRVWDPGGAGMVDFLHQFCRVRYFDESFQKWVQVNHNIKK